MSATCLDVRAVMDAILRIDRRRMEAAGLIKAGNLRSWTDFRRDPYRWILRLDEAHASTLWTLIQPHNQPQTANRMAPRPLLRLAHHQSRPITT